MAVVNRYSQVAPARYNPRSLQELMVAPAYMRKNHDALESSISQAETALAQVDNLDVHNPLVQKAQQAMYEKLESQAKNLADQGFNQANKSDFLRFNNEYQQAIGPKGILGKAQAAKKAYLQRRKELTDSAVKQGYDPTAVQSNLDRQYQEYVNSFDGENITNFVGQEAPKYQDFEEDLKNIRTQLGETVTTNRGEEGYEILTDPTTQEMVIKTESGQVITSNNNNQLRKANEFLRNKWLTPEGEGAKVDAYNNINPEYRQSLINDRLGVMQSSATKDTRQTKYDWNTLKSDDSSEETSLGQGLTFAGRQTVPQEFHKFSYTDFQDEIEDLEAKVQNGTASPKEIAKLEKAKDIYGQVQAKLTDNPEYNETLPHVQELELRLQEIENGTYDYIKNHPEYMNQYLNEEGEVIDREGASQAQNAVRMNLQSRLGTATRKLNRIADEYQRDELLERTEFAMTTPNPKTQKYLDQLTTNITSVIKTDPTALLQAADIVEVTDNDGKVLSDLDPKDLEGISKLAYDSALHEGNDITPAGVVYRGQSGRPEIVLNVPTKEVAYNMTNPSLFNWRGDIGGGKTVQVRLAFNENFDKSGIQKLPGLVQNFLAASSPEGAQFVQKQELNRFYSNYEGVKWNNIENQITKNPMISKVFKQKLIDKGITKESTAEEKTAAYNELLNEIITR